MVENRYSPTPDYLLYFHAFWVWNVCDIVSDPSTGSLANNFVDTSSLKPKMCSIRHLHYFEKMSEIYYMYGMATAPK